jgi:hypothetical protein
MGRFFNKGKVKPKTSAKEQKEGRDQAAVDESRTRGRRETQDPEKKGYYDNGRPVAPDVEPGRNADGTYTNPRKNWMTADPSASAPIVVVNTPGPALSAPLSSVVHSVRALATLGQAAHERAAAGQVRRMLDADQRSGLSTWRPGIRRDGHQHHLVRELGG